MEARDEPAAVFLDQRYRPATFDVEVSAACQLELFIRTPKTNSRVCAIKTGQLAHFHIAVKTIHDSIGPGHDAIIIITDALVTTADFGIVPDIIPYQADEALVILPSNLRYIVELRGDCRQGFGRADQQA